MVFQERKPEGRKNEWTHVSHENNSSSDISSSTNMPERRKNKEQSKSVNSLRVKRLAWIKKTKRGK